MPATVDQNMRTVRAELSAAAKATSEGVARVDRHDPPAHVRQQVYVAIDALERVLDDLRVIEE